MQAPTEPVTTFNSLYRVYEKLVFSLCLKMLGNRQDAEDVAQITWLKVWKTLSALKDEHVSSWVCQIARRSCIDFLRSPNGRKYPSIDEYEDIPAYDNPEQKALDRVEIALLFSKMDERSRLIMYLVYVKGLTHQEIAKVTGLEHTNVKTIVSRTHLFIRSREKRIA
jgi:RNA polymerase sigma factor (sigma-70 family)